MDFKSLSIEKPKSHEVECYVLGGGIGESIVLHFGCDRWIVIDSFINKTTGQPAALDLLNHLKVNLDNVSHVVATHWHDDHINGLSVIFKSAKKSTFVMPNALTSQEFIEIAQLQESHKKILTAIDTGVDELRMVLDIADERKSNGQTDVICLATKDRTIFEDSANSQKIVALSPSDTEFRNAINAFKRFIPDKDNAPKIRVPNPSPNDTAIVLSIDTPTGKFLLGADLETTADSDTGWKSAHRAAVGKGLALFFKISHHGSNGAHYAPVWTDLLNSDAHTVVTPYNNSHLPKKEDISRILTLRSDSHIAGGVSEKRFERPKAVDKTINQYVKKIRTLSTKVGMVSYKIPNAGQQPIVTYLGDAQSLSNLMNSLG